MKNQCISWTGVVVLLVLCLSFSNQSLLMWPLHYHNVLRVIRPHIDMKLLYFIICCPSFCIAWYVLKNNNQQPFLRSFDGFPFCAGVHIRKDSRVQSPTPPVVGRVRTSLRILSQSGHYGCQTVAPLANHPRSDPNVPAQCQKAAVSELPSWHELGAQDSTYGRKTGWRICLWGGARTRGHNQVFAEHRGQPCCCGREGSTIYAKLTGVLYRDFAFSDTVYMQD